MVKRKDFTGGGRMKKQKSGILIIVDATLQNESPCRKRSSSVGFFLFNDENSINKKLCQYNQHSEKVETAITQYA
jgi:hypothetical protein